MNAYRVPVKMVEPVTITLTRTPAIATKQVRKRPLTFSKDPPAPSKSQEKVKRSKKNFAFTSTLAQCQWTLNVPRSELNVTLPHKFITLTVITHCRENSINITDTLTSKENILVINGKCSERVVTSFYF